MSKIWDDAVLQLLPERLGEAATVSGRAFHWTIARGKKVGRTRD